jgi:uncharacterized protein YndB with AHSA1/START domain
MTNDRTTDDVLVIERQFAAPVDLVWQMWTDPKHFAAWYGPADATIAIAQLDVRVGGTRFVSMEIETPQGTMRMSFTGEFREVATNERLVYTESMADEAGNALSDPTEVRVVLEHVDGGTHMVMTHVGVAPDSPGATGWTMAFDKLAAALATA